MRHVHKKKMTQHRTNFFRSVMATAIARIANNRLTKELEELGAGPRTEFHLERSRRDPLVLRGWFSPPNDSNFQDVRVRFAVLFRNYPFNPPMIQLQGAKFYHPNVNLRNGRMYIYRDLWSPTFSLPTILRDMKECLDEPQLGSETVILNDEAAALYAADRVQYNTNVVHHAFDLIAEDPE